MLTEFVKEIAIMQIKLLNPLKLNSNCHRGFFLLPVVPHKAVAEVSKIGNL
jgi:hypothetical protein